MHFSHYFQGSLGLRELRGYSLILFPQPLVLGLCLSSYGGGSEFSLEKRVVVECLTAGGMLEFSIGISDVDLVLHYLNGLAAAATPW